MLEVEVERPDPGCWARVDISCCRSVNVDVLPDGIVLGMVVVVVGLGIVVLVWLPKLGLLPVQLPRGADQLTVEKDGVEKPGVWPSWTTRSLSKQGDSRIRRWACVCKI